MVSPLTCSIKTQKTKTFYLLYDLDYLGKVSWSDPNVASIWASPFLVVSERPVPSLAGPEPAVGSYIPPAIIQQTWFNTCKELPLENKGKIRIELVFHQTSCSNTAEAETSKHYISRWFCCKFFFFCSSTHEDSKWVSSIRKILFQSHSFSHLYSRVFER